MTETSMDVSGYDDEWEKIANPDAVLPDGKHTATITRSATVSANDKRWWVVEFSNAEGTVTKWSDFDHEVGRTVIKQDAVRLGYRGETFSGLVESIEQGAFDGIVCEIQVKTKAGTERDFTNVYINKALGRETPMQVSNAVPDEGIPF